MTEKHDPFAHWWSEELPPHVRAWLEEMLRLQIEQEDEQAAWDPADEIWDNISVYIEDEEMIEDTEMNEDDEMNEGESEEINPEFLQALRDSMQAEITERETRRIDDFAHVVWLQQKTMQNIMLDLRQFRALLAVIPADHPVAYHIREAADRIQRRIEELPAKVERDLEIDSL